jgi:hypothetical protein
MRGTTSFFVLISVEFQSLFPRERGWVRVRVKMQCCHFAALIRPSATFSPTGTSFGRRWEKGNKRPSGQAFDQRICKRLSGASAAKIRGDPIPRGQRVADRLAQARSLVA